MAEDTQEPQKLTPREKLLSSIQNAKADFENEMFDPQRNNKDWWQCFNTRLAQVKYAFLLAEKKGDLTTQEIEIGHINLGSLESEVKNKLGLTDKKTDKELLDALKSGKGLQPKDILQRSSLVLNGDYQVKTAPEPENPDQWFDKLNILIPQSEQELSHAA
jgi:hypothetical protein